MRNTTWMLALMLATTIGAAGCGSDDNDPSPTAPIDTAPPVLPSGLTVTYSVETLDVTIAWDANTTDLDFAGFLVARTAGGETVELVDQPQSASMCADNVQGVGNSFVYRVYSVDQSGNVSAAATIDLQVEVPQSRLHLDQQ